MVERLTETDRHESMRGYFGYALHEAMRTNPNVYFLTGDLGYGLTKFIERDFPDRYINCGASEQAMLGVAVGLAQEGKIPFVYSIPPFLLYRPFEWVRNYLNYEGANVKLVGSGRDHDYAHDGLTHDASDVKEVLGLFPNIVQYWPDENAQVDAMVQDMLTNNKPSYISLRR